MADNQTGGGTRSRRAQPEWARHIPSRWRMPSGGYVVEFRIVSDSYIRKVAGSAVWGYWAGFTGKRGIIYLNRDQTLAMLLDTLRHEATHALVDWGSAWMQDALADAAEEKEK